MHFILCYRQAVIVLSIRFDHLHPGEKDEQTCYYFVSGNEFVQGACELQSCTYGEGGIAKDA